MFDLLCTFENKKSLMPPQHKEIVPTCGDGDVIYYPPSHLLFGRFDFDLEQFPLYAPNYPLFLLINISFS